MTHFKPSDLPILLRRNPDLDLADRSVLAGLGFADLPHSLERTLQQAVIDECDFRALGDDRYGMIYANTNGQYRSGQRPEPGLRPGIPDLFLPVPSGAWHGLYIELKVGRNRPSAAQLDWMGRLRARGYRCEVVSNTLRAVMAVIDDYLDGDAR